MTGGDLDAIRIIWIIIFGEGAKVYKFKSSRFQKGRNKLREGPV